MGNLRKWLRIVEDQKGYRPSNNPLNSPEFRRWFGDSKAVDENGMPLVCYHGTKKDFDTFDPSLTGSGTDFGWFGNGIYLSPDARVSSYYAQNDHYAAILPQGHVLPLYVRAENPYITDDRSMSPSYAQEIRDEGYDAIFRVGYRSSGEIPEEIVVFNPNQVKSAIGNNGAFNLDDPRIQESTSIGNSIVAYRGVPKAAEGFSKAPWIFFTDRQDIAKGYAGDHGQVIKASLDLSSALTWSNATTKEFQDYVIWCRQHEQTPPGVKSALDYSNSENDTKMTLADAIGGLLRLHPEQVGWQELDPLMGFVRGFTKDQGCDVVIRPHEYGGGVKDGMEYIVFSGKRIKRVL